MTVTVTHEGDGRYLIACPAQMEWRARIDLVGAVETAVARHVPLRGIILDLQQVTFINSPGLGAIFLLHRHARDSGAGMVIARPGVSITRLLTTVNVPALMPVTATLDDARATLDQPASDGPET